MADFSDYKTSNNKRFGYIFVVIDNFSKYTWCILLKTKNSQTITKEISNISTTSKRKPECNRIAELNSIFQNFLKIKNIQHYARFIDKGPSIAERVITTIRNLLKKPVFLAENADWLSKLPSVIKKYNNTFHKSVKMTPIQAFKKSNEKEVYSILKGKREIQKPKIKLGQLIRTADVETF